MYERVLNFFALFPTPISLFSFLSLRGSLIAGLRFLVRLCTDMGLSDVQEYAARLKRAEKAKEAKEKVNDLLSYLLPSCVFHHNSFNKGLDISICVQLAYVTAPPVLLVSSYTYSPSARHECAVGQWAAG
jgi:hypothetical protein